MQEAKDGLTIALERIAEEAKQRTGFLDLGALGLTDLPPELFKLRHLRCLNLGAGIELEDGAYHEAYYPYETHPASNQLAGKLGLLRQLPELRRLSVSGTEISDLAPLATLSELQVLDCSHTQVSDLTPLATLSALQELNCDNTQVSDLVPLATLSALREFDCSSTQISDLAPLATLSALQGLYCNNTQASDLAPLATLSALRSLNCRSTQVSDLAPLATLSALRSLNCRSTQVSDLAPLAKLSALRSLDCSNTEVSNLASLATLSALQELKCLSTQVSDLTPLATLSSLLSLDCGNTQVSNLAPLATLSALQELNCSNTRVSDLAPLAMLSALQALDCGQTQVSDLAPLATLSALRSLNCANTQVSDLAPLATLSALRSLHCYLTQVSDLAPLARLSALQRLHCGATEVSDLAPLARLSTLQELNCSFTQVSDLAPLARLSALQVLQCGLTQVSDLAPLATLSALQALHCSDTQVSDLAPLARLTNLQRLDCSECSLIGLPAAVRDLPALQDLTLYRCRIPGIPAEILSQFRSENCLDSVRAHFRDLATGGVESTDVKLIVLGNGRVGKTQICRRLRNEDYDPDEPSTHGILVTSAMLDTGEAEKTRLNIWDFGGQDLYHGTHALFLRTGAIFLAVWARETENADTHEHQGIIFRNQNLPYWLAFVRHLAVADSPLLIVQTRCDRPQDQALAPPVPPDAVQKFSFCVPVSYSSLNNRGRPSLDEALRGAVADLHGRQGIAEIGIGRMHVLRALQDMRDDDAKLPPERRRHRTITQAHFKQLCDQAGNVSSPEQLLHFLHNAGAVFHRADLFRDQIVLDQGWALEAIYAVFNREKCFRELQRLRGRFSRPLLELLVWGEHSVDEQHLFLDMMRSCGICFVHRQGPRNDPDATEYLAPDLLPERDAVADDLAALWDPAQPTLSQEFSFEMLHPGLVRGLICEIGAEAGTAALYWRGGVSVYDTDTRSHALIEQHMHDAWHGTIRLQTQGGQAALLLQRLGAWIERRSGQDGLKAERIGTPPPSGPMARSEESKAGTTDGLPATIGPAPVAKPEYFVSYAWGDDESDAGREREAFVDRLCEAAQARGTLIIRDKTTLRLGDPISAFMRRIGAGDRVFVILSEKYLRSPWCMFELCEIWRYSRGEEAEFRRRVRVYALPDTKAGTIPQRMRHARFWKMQHDKIDAAIRKHGGETISTRDFAAFNRMVEFYRLVPDILATLFDTVQPRTFEELERYGFDDDPSF